ncbi:MAG: isomerase [Polaromonas sp.]|jgi:hypothetical protein|nr:isomerase [Polaromonas sp.]
MSESLHRQQPLASAMTSERATAQVVALFEAWTPASLDQLNTLYTANAYFKDPFNEVHGLAAIHGIFSHMFVALDKPRFIVTEASSRAGNAFLPGTSSFISRAANPPNRKPCAAPRTCGSAAKARSSFTATTGTRLKSCMRSCRWWGR